MSIDVYFATQDPAVLEIYDKLVAQFDLWKADMIELIKPWGFDDCRADAFKAPVDFLVKTPNYDIRQGPVIPGFKGGSVVGGTGGPFFSYTVHGKQGREFRAQLTALAEKHMQPEQLDHFGWAVRSFKQVLCKRLDVFSRVCNGRYLQSTQCHVLMYEGGEREVVINVPSGEDGNVFVAPKLTALWTEITGSHYLAKLNRHNARLPKPEKKEVDDDDF